MKVNFLQLLEALSTLKYDYGWDDKAIKEVSLDITLSNEDPGNGIFIDTIKFSSESNTETALIKRELEVYDDSSKEAPAFTKSQTKRLKKEEK